jgi:hypothetical protein
MTALTISRACFWSQDTRAPSVRSISMNWPPENASDVESKAGLMFDMLRLVGSKLVNSWRDKFTQIVNIECL